jgi:hypothetical protein
MKRNLPAAETNFWPLAVSLGRFYWDILLVKFTFENIVSNN